jgi:hypothetical protein
MASSKRALFGRLIRRATKKASEKLMSTVGGGLVSGMADTSSDAPSGGYQPKRNRYAEMQAEAKAAEEARRRLAQDGEADHDRGHSHTHDHGHSHDH